MAEFISTFMISAILFIALVLIIIFMVKRHKNGISACGCDCSRCSGCSNNANKSKK